MKNIFICYFIFGLAWGVEIGELEYSPQKIKDVEKGLSELRSLAANAASLSPEEAIPRLGQGLRKTSIASIYVVGDREGVRKDLQAALLAIPGHAEYFGNRIDQLETAGENYARQQGVSGYSIPPEQIWAFQTLEYLPSPETVRVLGEMLYDERGRRTLNSDHSNAESYVQQDPIANRAIRALIKLVQDPPTEKEPAVSEVGAQGRAQWQSWYRQIKEGRRTFKFKGNPQEYDLSGPVAESKNPDLPRPDRRPDGSVQTKNSTTQPTTESHALKSGSKEPSNVTAPWITGGLLILCASAAIFLFRRKSQDE